MRGAQGRGEWRRDGVLGVHRAPLHGAAAEVQLSPETRLARLVGEGGRGGRGRLADNSWSFDSNLKSSHLQGSADWRCQGSASSADWRTGGCWSWHGNRHLKSAAARQRAGGWPGWPAASWTGSAALGWGRALNWDPGAGGSRGGPAGQRSLRQSPGSGTQRHFQAGPKMENYSWQINVSDIKKSHSLFPSHDFEYLQTAELWIRDWIASSEVSGVGTIRCNLYSNLPGHNDMNII